MNDKDSIGVSSNGGNDAMALVENEPDEVLLMKIRKKDSIAMEALILRHREAICRHIKRIVCDPESSEDMSQEVFLRVRILPYYRSVR